MLTGHISKTSACSLIDFQCQRRGLDAPWREWGVSLKGKLHKLLIPTHKDQTQAVLFILSSVAAVPSSVVAVPSSVVAVPSCIVAVPSSVVAVPPRQQEQWQTTERNYVW